MKSPPFLVKAYLVKRILFLFIVFLTILIGIKCFIVQNLHIYLDDRECENLLESAVMHGIYLLNIENSVPKEVSEYEKLVVIDNDLCEFY